MVLMFWRIRLLVREVIKYMNLSRACVDREESNHVRCNGNVMSNDVIPGIITRYRCVCVCVSACWCVYVCLHMCVSVLYRRDLTRLSI